MGPTITKEIESELSGYKKRRIIAARELGYSQEIIRKIETANTFFEVDRAMATGRHAMNDDNLKEVNRKYGTIRIS